MSSPAPKHRAATHRGEPRRAVRRTTGRVVRRTAVLTSTAATVTGVAVAGGVLSGTASVPPALAAQDLTVALPGHEVSTEREPVTSRSDRRSDTDQTKQAVLSTGDSPTVSRVEDLSDADPRQIAIALLPEYGFTDDQFSCLDALYVSESNWRINADNPYSSAYGIPQALTATHDMPAGYFTDAEVQIRWGLEYIRDTYGTPCGAWSFKAGHGWY